MTEKQGVDFKQGDKAAFDCLYKQFAPAMFGICMRFTNCRDDAQEVLQESFIKIYEKRSHYDIHYPLASWIKKIVIHTAINYLKKQKKLVLTENELEFDQEESELDTEIPIERLRERLLLILQELPAGYRTVFNLYVIDNWSHNEIAEHLGIAVGTSKSQLAKAKQMIQKLIPKLAQDERA